MKKLVKPTVKSNAVPNSLGKCMCSSFCFGNPLESNYRASTRHLKMLIKPLQWNSKKTNQD